MFMLMVLGGPPWLLPEALWVRVGTFQAPRVCAFNATPDAVCGRDENNLIGCAILLHVPWRPHSTRVVFVPLAFPRTCRDIEVFK